LSGADSVPRGKFARVRRALLGLGVALVVLAGTGLVLDRLFPLNLSRLAFNGTEVLDRQGKTVALLPAQAEFGGSGPRPTTWRRSCCKP
jgi:hypothetical protein